MDEKKIINFLLESGKLKTIKRAGWAKIGVREPESVADHTYRVSMLALILGKKLKVSENKLLKLALLHDLAEARTGDFISDGERKEITREEKSKLEKRAVKEMAKLFSGGREILSLWKEFDEGKTKEAKIALELDKLEMAIQALEYEKAGMKKEILDQFWVTSKKYVKNKELLKILSELEKMRP
jgi:putative hydrolase of HD superfamily